MLIFLLSGFAGSGSVLAQGVDPGDFSLDGLSRIEVPSKFHAADLIAMTGGNIHIAHGRLGLPDEPVATESDIDAFSYGKDKLAPFGPRFFVSLEYSVSRGSLGGGRVVTAEVTPPNGNGNAGDKFRLYRLFSGRVVGPWKEQDAKDIGLTVLPSPDESEIDGLSWPPGTQQPVYFSVSLDTAQKQGLDAAAIYYVPGSVDQPDLLRLCDQRAARPAGGFRADGDDIDALAINDLGLGGTFEPADIVYVSLGVGDPTHRLYFPAGAGDGVIQLSPVVQPPVSASCPERSSSERRSSTWRRRRRKTISTPSPHSTPARAGARKTRRRRTSKPRWNCGPGAKRPPSSARRKRPAAALNAHTPAALCHVVDLQRGQLGRLCPGCGVSTVPQWAQATAPA